MGGREEEVMAEKGRREEMLRDAERLVALLREGQDGSWHMSVDETMREAGTREQRAVSCSYAPPPIQYLGF